MALYKVEICGVNTAKLPILSEDEKVKLLSNSTTFRYNATSGQNRFRYFKTSTTGDLYIFPSIYKLVTGDEPNVYPVKDMDIKIDPQTGLPTCNVERTVATGIPLGGQISGSVENPKEVVFKAEAGRYIDVSKVELTLEKGEQSALQLLCSNDNGLTWFEPVSEVKKAKTMVDSGDMSKVNAICYVITDEIQIKSVTMKTDKASFITSASFSVDYTYNRDNGSVVIEKIDSAKIRLGTEVFGSIRFDEYGEDYKFGYIIVNSDDEYLETSIIDDYNELGGGSLEEFLEIYDSAKRTTKTDPSAFSEMQDGTFEYGVKLNVLESMKQSYNVVFYVADASDNVVEFGEEVIVSLPELLQLYSTTSDIEQAMIEFITK